MTFILTSDVDFVSDDFLDSAYRPLKELPLTIFMTGRSEVLPMMMLTIGDIFI